jgi:hypothetical protein
MDFIERILNISPDGGSGGFELLMLAVPLAVAAWWARRRRSLRGGRNG